ncbi:MAG: hypothetical protein AVDCRST_MAG88-4548, partial [uncultured Thermomicrobiales bacterium]
GAGIERLADDHHVLVAELVGVVQEGHAGEGADIAEPPWVAPEEGQRLVVNARRRLQAEHLLHFQALLRRRARQRRGLLHRQGAAQRLPADRPFPTRGVSPERRGGRRRDRRRGHRRRRR